MFGGAEVKNEEKPYCLMNRILKLFIPGTIVNIVAALDALDVNQFAAAMVAHIQLMADMRAKLCPFSGLVLGDDPSRVFVDESSLSVSFYDFQLRFVFIQLGNHGVPRAEFFPALFHFEIRPSSSENVTYLSSTLHFHFKKISSVSIRLKILARFFPDHEKA